MKTIALVFPSANELDGFNEVIGKKDYSIDLQNRRIIGRFDESEIELACNGFSAQVAFMPHA